ncbi:DUF4876 domain-containing protein [Prevotella sp.]|uniref:DUF4876 domain-containing protein n=1 Tax=Prevotella sp. TaxID=59823 RepID=UPI002F93AA95
MKSFLKSKLPMALMALCSLSACNNGGPDPVIPDSEKVVDHLIFKEICYTGTLHATKNYSYPYDSYIKIMNPTADKTFYLDGLCLVQTGLSCSKIVELKEKNNFISTHFGASRLVQFPGSGQQYPIKPGEEIIITGYAIDHTKETEEMWNPASYDLSGAKFEWYSPEQIKEEEIFEDNADVPNMKTLFPEDGNDIVFTMIPEEGALALVKLPDGVTMDKLLKEDEYKWVTTWTEFKKEGNGQGSGHSHNNESDPVEMLKIPNAWVVDAVQICPQQDYKWSVVGPELDRGYKSVLTSSRDKRTNPQALAGKSLVRRWDGKKYVDGNNSSQDFEVRDASLSAKGKSQPVPGASAAQ